MQQLLPIDTGSLNSAHSARLLAYYEAFCSPDEERHLWLAAHAAFPVVLTSDLLYKLWLNFRLDEQGDPLNIPMIAVSDLLLSTLCRPTSRQVYEIPQDIRTALLLYLKGHPRFGVIRVQRLAHFLKFYLRENPRQLPSRAFAKAQEFTWLAQLDPQIAAEQLLEAWNRQKDKERLRQLLAWSEQQAQLLSGEEGQARYNPLSVAIQILRGFQHFQEGKQAEALQELEALKGRARKEQPEGGDGIRMDIPQSVLERLPGNLFGERPTDEEREEGTKFTKIHLLTSPGINPDGLLNKLAGIKEKRDFQQPINILSFERPFKQSGQNIHLNYTLWQWTVNETSNALDSLLLTPKGIYILYFPLVRDEAGRPDYSAFSLALHRLRLRFERPQVIGLFENRDGPNIYFGATELRAEFPELAEVFFLDQEETGFSALQERIDQLVIERAEQDSNLNAVVARMAADLRQFPETILSKEFFWKRWGKIASPQQNPERILAELVNIGRLVAAVHLTPQGAIDKVEEYIQIINYPAPFAGQLFQLFSPEGLLATGKGELSVPDFKSHWGFAGLPGEPDQMYSLLGFYQLAFLSKPGNTIVFPHALPRKLLDIEFDFTQYETRYLIYRFTSLPFDLFPKLTAKLGSLDMTSGMRYTVFQVYFEEENTPIEGRILEREKVVQFRSSGKYKDALLEKTQRHINAAIQFSFPLLHFKTAFLHIPAHATPDMIPIEGGTFQMGDVMDDNEYDREKPVHEVTLGNFALGSYPVTFQEYDAFCEAVGRGKPEDQGWGRANRPAINVDWYDAIEYCNWLSELWGLEPAYQIEKDKKDPNNQRSSDKKKWLVTPNWQANGYRLPTEAEWEYAARAVVSPSGRGEQGGGKVRFGNGKDIADPKEINFNASEQHKKPYSVAGEYREKTAPVGSFPPNALGLYDMSGNVYDWCWDWFDGNYYKQFESQPVEHPTGPEGGSSRVRRGGSWFSDPLFVRAADRSYVTPDGRYSYVGFRLARTL